MKDFIMRTVSDSINVPSDAGQALKCECSRMRTSAGGAGISLRLDLPVKQNVTLRIDRETFGDQYEQIALDIADLLRRVAMNPCELPTTQTP